MLRACLPLILACMLTTDVHGQGDPRVSTGVEALGNGAYDRARELLTAALSDSDSLSDQESARAHFYRGMAIISSHQEALRVKRPSPIEDAYLKTCHDLNESEARDASAWSGEIRQLRQELFRPLLSEGIRSLNGRDYSRARDYLDCVVDIGSRVLPKAYWPAYDMRGQSRLALQDSTGALEDLETAARVYHTQTNPTPDPLIAYVYYRMAQLQRVMNDDVEQALAAINSGKQALSTEVAKISEGTHEGLLQQRVDQANADIERLELEILRQYPKHYDAAVARFEEALAENPADYDLLLGLAAVHEVKNRESAERTYRNAIAAAPGRAAAYFNLAVMHFNQGADLSVSLQNPSNSSNRQAIRDDITALFQAAVPLFERVHELDPDRPDPLDALIQIARYLNRNDEAERYTEMKSRINNR